MATHDFVDTTGGADLPIILPSQQAQESWHQKLVRTLMAKLRQPLETVLVELLPKIALRDTTSLPEKLLFTSAPASTLKLSDCAKPKVGERDF